MWTREFLRRFWGRVMKRDKALRSSSLKTFESQTHICRAGGMQDGKGMKWQKKMVRKKNIISPLERKQSNLTTIKQIWEKMTSA